MRASRCEAAARALVLAEVRGQDLDGHAAVEQLVVRLPDARHAAVGDVAHDAVAVGQGDVERSPRATPSTRTQRASAAMLPARNGPYLSLLRQAPRLRPEPLATPWSPRSAVSTRTCRRSASPTAAHRKRVYVCTRCLKAGKVTKAVARAAALADPSLVRFRTVVQRALAELEARREEVNDLNVFPVADGDTGDNMALTLRAVLDELDRLQDARRDRRDRPRRDRRLRRPRGAARRARQLRRDPLPADPRRRRGARLAARRARRPGADRRRDGARRRPRVRLGARARRGHDPHRRARDGAPRRHRARAHARAAARAGRRRRARTR